MNKNRVAVGNKLIIGSIINKLREIVNKGVCEDCENVADLQNSIFMSR